MIKGRSGWFWCRECLFAGRDVSVFDCQACGFIPGAHRGLAFAFRSLAIIVQDSQFQQAVTRLNNIYIFFRFDVVGSCAIKVPVNDGRISDISPGASIRHEGDFRNLEHRIEFHRSQIGDCDFALRVGDSTIGNDFSSLEAQVLILLVHHCFIFFRIGDLEGFLA